MTFVVGYNTPGYMPEMEPYECSSEHVENGDAADYAKRTLIDEMLQHADSADDIGAHALASELSHAAEDLNLTDVSQGYSVTICDPERENDLGTHYWIDGPNPYPYDR